MISFLEIDCTVFPRSSHPFYIVTYYIKLVTTSWTYSTIYILDLKMDLGKKETDQASKQGPLCTLHWRAPWQCCRRGWGGRWPVQTSCSARPAAANKVKMLISWYRGRILESSRSVFLLYIFFQSRYMQSGVYIEHFDHSPKKNSLQAYLDSQREAYYPERSDLSNFKHYWCNFHI